MKLRFIAALIPLLLLSGAALAQLPPGQGYQTPEEVILKQILQESQKQSAILQQMLQIEQAQQNAVVQGQQQENDRQQKLQKLLNGK